MQTEMVLSARQIRLGINRTIIATYVGLALAIAYSLVWL